MLSLFRTNQFLFSIFLIPYAYLVRSSYFFFDRDIIPHHNGILTELLYKYFPPESELSFHISIFLLLVHAITINYIVNTFRLSKSISLLPGLFYIFFASFYYQFHYTSPILLGNTFIIFAFGEISGVYKKYACKKNVFNSGFFIGLASLFYFGFLSFLPLALMGLRKLRNLSFQELVLFFVGILNPIYLLGTYFYFIGELPNFINQHFIANLSIFSYDILFDLNDKLAISLVSIFILFIVFNIPNLQKKKSLQAQMTIQMLLLFFLAPLLTFFIQNSIQIDILLMFAPILGIFVGIKMLEMKPMWAELIHFILIFGIGIWQFAPFIIKM